MSISRVVATLVGAAFTFCAGCTTSDEIINERLESLNKQVISHPDDREALSTLASHASHRSFVIRANTMAYLGTLSRKYGERVSDLTVPVLIKGLGDSNQGVRRVAAEAFAQMHPDQIKRAIPELIPLLKNDNDVGWFSADALGKLGTNGGGAVPALIEALESKPLPGVQDEAPQLRLYAARALGSLGSPTANLAMPNLKDAMRDKNPFLSLEAAKALLAIETNNSEAFLVVKQFASSSRPSLREDAIYFLKKRHPVQ